MDWKEAAKEAVEDIEKDGIRGGVEDLHEQYMVDQGELAKLLIISSLSLMVVSIPSSMALGDAHSEVESATESLSGATSVAGSDAFSSSIQTLQDRLSGNIASSLDTVMDSLDRASDTTEKLEQTESRLENQAETYRWLSLVSIVGLVAGFTLMYV